MESKKNMIVAMLMAKKKKGLNMDEGPMEPMMKMEEKEEPMKMAMGPEKEKKRAMIIAMLMNKKKA